MPEKDRHAVTEQWFSVHLPGRAPLTWSLFERETIQVLKATKHGRKLRLGSLTGNRFAIRLRNVTDVDDVMRRCELVRQGFLIISVSSVLVTMGNLTKGPP
ncbi:tRNA pseudouridine(13) synthase TruD [Aliamphritea spongicola]|nr:tRNA pseudouridine(13) synthase TruD [Aliamphritea spongicola]